MYIYTCGKDLHIRLYCIHIGLRQKSKEVHADRVLADMIQTDTRRGGSGLGESAGGGRTERRGTG